jgi:CheY-like chemotaxis protein
MRILWVDDEEVIREIGASFLVQAGHTVDTARNNKEALALYEEDAYDLVLTDAEHLEPVWQNPDGGEGLILAEALRRKNPQQRVGFITAHDQITGYPTLNKPFDPEQLLRFVTGCSHTDSVR